MKTQSASDWWDSTFRTHDQAQAMCDKYYPATRYYDLTDTQVTYIRKMEEKKSGWVSSLISAIQNIPKNGITRIIGKVGKG